MAALNTTQLRAEISARGLTWKALDLPADFVPRGLGWSPTPAPVIQPALQNAQRLMAVRMPELLRRSMVENTAATAQPQAFDWRSRGVIGPVTDQAYCGSCVSFATTGLVAAMAAIEAGRVGLHLSEADQHFCSAHGATCFGWNNGDALNEIKNRGVVADADLPYMSAFDSPPKGDPRDTADKPPLWLPYARAVDNRGRKTWHVTEVHAWSGDDRKTYLANVGPLVCGFEVFQDFDAYGGGVYHHVSGNSRGGHAVLVVGYSDVEQCWICRNSWGTGFGGSTVQPDGTGAGFFKIGYGQCSIDNEPFFGAQGVIAPADSGWRGWWPVAGGVAAPGTSVFGVSRSPDKMDVFCVGTDHGTYAAAWQPGDTAFRGWWRVQGGVAAPNTSVTAVTRSPDKLDIFCVGTDQRIYTAAWQAGDTAWRGWWPVAGGVAALGTSVFGVSRSPDKMDVFCIGTDMQVYTAAWQAGDTNWRGWWPIGHFKAAPGSSVHAVSRSPDKLDIFAVGADNGVYSAAWQAGDTHWRAWTRILEGVAAPSTMVTAVVRNPDHLDIFVIGSDHHVYTAAWQP